MNLEIIKRVYEHTPKTIKYACAPVLQRVILWNPKFKSAYRELEEFEKMSYKDQEMLCLTKLKNILIYAYENTEYYREVFERTGFNPYNMTSLYEITALPLLDKSVAVKEGERMYSKEHVKYYETCTSGSTGKVFKVLADKDLIYKERAFVTHYLNKFGLDAFHAKTLAFWGHNKDADYYYSPLKNEIVISPFRLFQEELFLRVWKDVVKFKPDLIAGYPSAIYLFAQLVRKYKKTLPVKLVEFYAENYTPEIKSYVEDTFQCKAMATYGHTERVVFAELYEEGYKFNDLYGFTELLPLETKDGQVVYRIVSTGFDSRKMPLIRYATDDVAFFNREGRLEIRGHTTSEARVIGKNGERIYKGTLAPHIEPFKKARLYQYVQYERGKVWLDVILEEPFTDEDYRMINAYYKRKCEGLLEIQIRVVDQPILNKRGKYSWLVSYIEEEQE